VEDSAYLEVLGADGGHVGDAQYEADCVQDVGLAGAIEAGDGVEAFIPIFSVCCQRCYSNAEQTLPAQSIYHPEITVRTAYDLKPYRGRQ